ncbi:MAG: glutamate 5-kinase [Gammaproteobacteria bacterium]|nr:glutamate 5-kinase [Gammaproteobacteria bacterium]
MTTHQHTNRCQRWVIKIGSALLTNDGKGLNLDSLDTWVQQMAQLRESGIELVLVSSGAVAEVMTRLGWAERPPELNKLQAAAAVGQMGLIQAYESRFQQYGMHTAQILLTHDDLSNRERYLNARSTLRTLLEMGVVPVVNENDTVAMDEVRFGDNDTLGALVANLVEADQLVILTDQTGLYDKDPRHNPDAALIHEAQADDDRLEAMASGKSGSLGRGGMLTKVRAARLAARSGTTTTIASGQLPEVLMAIASGKDTGTRLLPGQELLAARKQWLAGQLQVRGQLTLDAGAINVLRESGRSLLAVGVKAVAGDFARGEMVACVDEDGKEVARGLVNYQASETELIMGQPSHRIEELLGYIDEPELIHRDNLILV